MFLNIFKYVEKFIGEFLMFTNLVFNEQTFDYFEQSMQN